MSLLVCLLAVQAVKASRHRPTSVARSMLLVFLICGKVICFVWQWVLSRLAIVAVSFSNCCCFVWQRVLSRLAMGAVSFGKGCCLVWQLLLFCLAIVVVLFSNCCCLVWQLLLFCLAMGVGGLGLPIGFRPFLAWTS